MIGLGVRAANAGLEILDLPQPRQPEAGEITLDVITAGIGPWDSLLHTGVWDVNLVLPAALGVEAVGRVAKTSPDETEFRIGDLVLVHEAPLPGGSGTWAQQVLVQSAHVARLPENLTPTLGAALPVAGLTAQQTLDELQVQPSTRLLIVGASGPTASLAVQLAHLRGAEVVAGAGPAYADKLRALGASDVIDTHIEGWADETAYRFDSVLIAATGTAEDAMRLIVDGGRLCSITSDAPDSAAGITTSNLYLQPDGQMLTELAALAAAGKLGLEVQTTPIQDGIEIANQVAAGRSGGVKHVLEL